MNVHCSVLTPTSITYECPNCWFDRRTKKTHTTNYSKAGAVIRSRLPSLHYHGNALNQKENRVEYRTSHCIHAKSRDICIIIDDRTRRLDFPREHKDVTFYDVNDIIKEEPEPELIEPSSFVRVPMI